ncbi:MAG: hypothetical protein WA118_05785 [Carboxydocellales bacterium]
MKSFQSPFPQKKGDSVIFNTDEGPHTETTLDAFAKLPPVFTKDGSVQRVIRQE